MFEGPHVNGHGKSDKSEAKEYGEAKIRDECHQFCA